MGGIRRAATWLGAQLADLVRSGRSSARRLGQPESRARTVAVQIAKATVAAIIAWYVAGELVGSQTAWLATITAVLMVHSTVYRSISEGIQRVVAVATGVGIAAAAGNLIGLNAMGLLVVVPLSLLGARLRWIRADGEYIAVTAVILLTFGMSTQEQLLLSYVRDTALGAAIGTLVNLLLFPPGYQRTARTAVSELASHTAGLLRDLAEGARSGWDADTADHWFRAADDLRREAKQAQEAIEWSREGQRWNPWPRREGTVPARRYQPAVDTLWHVAIEMESMTRSLRDAADTESAPEPLRQHLAPVLESVAEVVETYGDDPAPRRGGLSPPVARALEDAEQRYRDLAARLPTAVDEAAPFEASGALMQDLRRIPAHLREASRRPAQ